MKTIADLENMKNQCNSIFGTAYESFIGTLEDYYIGKLDGKKRIAYEFELWDKDAQRAIANVLIERINQEMNINPNDILSLIK